MLSPARFSVTMIIFPEVAPVRFRNVLAPVIGTVISMAGVLGPVLGGALTRTSWRWVFLIKYVRPFLFPTAVEHGFVRVG